ncbi:MAG: amidase [Alphaproteobacteria bacterium]|jgi:amidase|nr:amidase [Alphaproteobacteria bacterium]PPR14442.1 MAG: Acylamidase [Alphaproteobacteria bacterium MarineAlpha12_Bin1]|tara:strand:- start:23164 stop:24603 length:1440 start_codon:yes stop_codon:yes gene_type:complete
MTGDVELTNLTAQKAVELLKLGEIVPSELVDAVAKRIEEVNCQVNALPTLCLDKAYEQCSMLIKPDAEDAGWLAGLPIVVKDLNEIEDVLTTYGSNIFSNHIPESDEISVSNLRRSGAVFIGKSNTPEFGAGANTFNEVFGKTLNPWNTDLTCGGSSGGSAVALATGMAWLATGSDLGGSLRTPASFCSVVGMRPSPGRVPHGPSRNPFQMLSVDGPMGRTVGDVALMLDAEVGRRNEDPISLEHPLYSFQEFAARPQAPAKIGFTTDLGIGPVDQEVATICSIAAQKFESEGSIVVESSPDCSGIIDIFQVLRAALFVGLRAPLLEKHREFLKPEVIWNIEKGMNQSVGDVSKAWVAQGELYRRVISWFDQYDLLALPSAIVPPFDVNNRYLDSLGDHKFNNYIEWVYVSYLATLASLPAISVPCGFTSSGLPVGLQLVGKPRGEAQLLSFAAKLEEIVDLGLTTPINPISGPKSKSI